MQTRTIYLVNPKTKSFTTRPIYMNRALYSPLAGLLAVAAVIPEDEYEVILADENIEDVDFDMECDLVGISAMTSYVNRGYEIADRFRQRGVPVIMGGVHPSFIPGEALTHADAVVIGEVELVIDKVLADLRRGELRGTYRSTELCSMVDMKMPRYDLVKKNRYVNSTFIQTSRGCHQGCTFCAEPLMNGLKFRYRPVDEVIREVDECGARYISLNDADFFGTPERPKEIMRALKGRNVRWQAGVTSRLALKDDMLELAAESGCYMLSVGFESISRETLRGVHKHVNHPDKFRELVEKIHGYGILVFGLFIFGFDTDDATVFDETVKFNVDADYDMCAYSTLTPYPGTLTWYEMVKKNKVVSYDWDNYDQGHVVYKPDRLTPHELRDGQQSAYKGFYSLSSIARRFPWITTRSRFQWSIYNLFFRRGEVTGSAMEHGVAPPTAVPEHLPVPPIMPIKKEWKQLVLEGIEEGIPDGNGHIDGDRRVEITVFDKDRAATGSEHARSDSNPQPSARNAFRKLPERAQVASALRPGRAVYSSSGESPPEEMVMVSEKIAVFAASVAVLGGSTTAGEVAIPTFTDATATRLSAGPSVGEADLSEKDYGLGDFDNDGDVDVLSARRSRVKINTGQPLPNTLFMNESGVLTDRTVDFAPALLASLRSRDVAVADFNNDGWLDALVVHGPSTAPTLLVNLGGKAGAWLGLQKRPDLLPVGFTVDGWNVSTGDITGDGFDDAFVGVRLGDDRLLVNLGNDKGGAWLGFADESSRLGTNANTTAVRSSVIVDINGDGDMDLIEGQTCCDGIVRLIPNDGAGNLDGVPQNIVTGQAYNFALGHLDGDGNLDILGVRNANDQFRLGTGPQGDGVGWGPLIDVPASNGFGSIVRVADLNHDGTDDFLVCDLDQEFPENCTRRLNIYFNSGVAPYLVDGYPTPVAWTPNGTSDVAMIDLDDDGDLDMLLGWCTGQSVFMQDGSPFCDVDGDNVIGIGDLLIVLASWGSSPGCPADLDGDDVVGILDFLILLAQWGPCP